MKPASENDPDRVDDLLADKALEGLTPEEEAELAALAGHNDESLDLTAASVDMAIWNESALERLPEGLSRRIQVNYRNATKPAAPPVSLAMPERATFSRAFSYAGWLTAAAAVIVAAFFASRPSSDPVRPVPAADSASVANSLLRLASFSPKATLEATDHPLAQGALGELVWNRDEQKGFMKIEGLAPVDPKKGTYQLWIFDRKRDQRYPVDGGTFAISENGTSSLVPIQARLRVDEPTMFAITLEPPGGVVVSDRQRIMLTANWDGND